MSNLVEAARRLTERSTELIKWCAVRTPLGSFPELDHCFAATQQLVKLLPPLETWMEGPPPRRGAYRVKASNGKSAGFRYWGGMTWGNLHNIRSYCVEKKCNGRSSRIASQVLWLKKGALK